MKKAVVNPSKETKKKSRKSMVVACVKNLNTLYLELLDGGYVDEAMEIADTMKNLLDGIRWED